MDFTELKGQLDQPKKIYLLEGEDAYFRSRGLELIEKKFISEPDFNLTNFEGSSLKGNGIDALIGVLQMCPFLSDYRIIAINEWYPLAADLKNKELSAFFSSPLTSTIMIVSNKAKCEMLKKQPQVEFVDCKKADARIIARYVQAKAAQAKLIISKSNCDLIADFCNFDMAKVSTETEKIIGFSIGQTEITEDIINELVTKETDYKIYEIVNFIAMKNFDKAYEILSEMIDAGNQQILLVSLYNHFKRLLTISLSKDSDAELASILGIKEYAVKKSREQLRGFTPKRLMKITDCLINYDAKFKTGEIALAQALINSVFMIMTEN